MTLREKQSVHNKVRALKEAMENRKGDLLQGIQSLEANIQELESILEQKRVALIATNGAMQDCDHWLGYINNMTKTDENHVPMEDTDV